MPARMAPRNVESAMPILAAATAATRLRLTPWNEAKPAGSAPSAAKAPCSMWPAHPTESERRQHTGGRPCGAPRSDGAPVEGAELDQPPPPESAEEPCVESPEGTHAGAMAAIRRGALTSPPAPPRTA